MIADNPYQKGKLLLIDKPVGITSFGVIKHIRDRIKDAYGIKKIKVGHAGTLDPLASGLLIICTGKMTKKISEYTGMDKTYTGTFVLGAVTPSYDRETEVSEEFPIAHITKEKILKAAAQLTGEIMQKPPVFSAIKKKGERLYHKARRGEEVEIRERKVIVHEFEITRVELPEVDFRVVCGKGTYIRSLAYDFGKLLDSGAFLGALRREAIGNYRVQDAVALDDFKVE